MSTQSPQSSTTAQRKTILLVDGFYLLFRAFHAIPSTLRTSTGELTNAVYGFASMLLSKISEVRPDYVAIAFDREGPTFRHEEYEGYKATRPPMDEDLRIQIPRVQELINAFGFPICDAQGAEADDVLGALALKAIDAGLDVAIVTGDMDLLQLVNEHVRVLWPGRRIAETKVYDSAAAVQETYGITPEQIPDYKALAGDQSDNIKGLPGVGPKTAARWLAQWGTLEEVLAHADELPKRFRPVIAEHAEEVRHYKRLATIWRGVPCDLDLDQAHVHNYQRDQVVELFRQLEFRSLLRQLPDVGSSEAAQLPLLSAGDAGAHAEPAAITVAVLTDPAAISAAVRTLATSGTLVIHPIATVRSAADIDLGGLALAGAAPDADPVFVPLARATQADVGPVMAALRPFLADPALPKLGHDTKRLMAILAPHGVKLEGLADDTMIAAYLVSPASRGLSVKDLALAQLGEELTDPASLVPRRSARGGWTAIEPQELARVAGAEAVRLPQIAALLTAQLKDRALLDLYRNVELPLIPVLAEMELAGVSLDAAYLAEMSRELAAQIAAIEQGIYADVGHEFSVNSPQQFSRVLVDELHLPLRKRTKTGYSTDVSVLQELIGAHPVIEKVLEYRQLTKLKSTYIDALSALINPRTGRVHTTFNQTMTATGRLSSSDPNLQNIPIRTELGRRIRRAFIAERPGWVLLAADYAQIELRIAAHLSRDPLLMQAFHEGVDVHTATAATLFHTTPDAVTEDQRRLAKTANFAMLYGISDWGLAQRTDMTREEAGPFIERYLNQYTGIRDYIKRTVQHAKDYGWVETPLHRRRYLPELRARSRPVRAAGERMAINHPIQGGQADLIKLAMIAIDRDLKAAGVQARMILQVHDELVFELPEDEVAVVAPIVKQQMEQAMTLDVPIIVEMKCGPNWGELAPLPSAPPAGGSPPSAARS